MLVHRRVTTSIKLADTHWLLVFSVTPFKTDQDKNKNRSKDRVVSFAAVIWVVTQRKRCVTTQITAARETKDRVQNQWKVRKSICNDSRQDSGHSNFSYERYAEICMETPHWCPIEMGTNTAAGNQQKHLSLSLLQKGELMELKNVKIILFSNTITVQIAKFPQLSHF